MKKFSKSLKGKCNGDINFKVKKMKLLTNKQQELYEMQKFIVVRKNNLKINMLKIKKYYSHFAEEYRTAPHSICNLKCSVPKEIRKVFHNGSNYDYNFIIKVLRK